MIKGEPIYYNKLMLGCEEKNLERVLSPTKFFPTRPATFTYSNKST